MKQLTKNPKMIFFIAFLTGILLILISLKMPRYTDESQYQELVDMVYQEAITKDAFYGKVHQITTTRNTIMDIGNGIVSFALFGIVFLLISKIRNWEDLKRLKTQSKLAIFISANLALLLLIPGTVIYYGYRDWRGDFPPFADSIGIPIMQQTTIILLMLIPLNILLCISLYKSKLPTDISIHVRVNNKFFALWNVFFGSLLLLNVICLIMFIIDGDHISVMVSMYFMYLLFSLRAGKFTYGNL